MVDIEFIRNNPERVQEAAEQKRATVDVKELLTLDTKRRGLQSEIDQINAQRNEHARHTGTGKPAPEALVTGRKLKEELNQLESSFKQIDQEFMTLWQKIPNIPSDDTPVGRDESENEVLYKVGTPREFSFTPKPHWEIGEQLDLIDTKKAAIISGPRFAYLKSELVFLQFALIQLAFTTLTNQQELERIVDHFKLSASPKTFVPILPPVLIKPEIMQEMDRLEPRDERYHTGADDLYLIGSAEHTLGPLHRAEILPASELPIRYIGYSPAFRRESGSYGKDVRGILRLHQFDKIEMESFSTPAEGRAEQDLFVAIQEDLMQKLELPYQVVQICTGDMGKPDTRQIDIETWLPSEGKYRETHTSDYMTDYQARRLKIRTKLPNGSTEFVHMNDATVFSGRPLIAILENHQQADGSIAIPEALHPYLPFTTIPARQ